MRKSAYRIKRIFEVLLFDNRKNNSIKEKTKKKKKGEKISTQVEPEEAEKKKKKVYRYKRSHGCLLDQTALLLFLFSLNLDQAGTAAILEHKFFSFIKKREKRGRKGCDQPAAVESKVKRMKKQGN